MIAAAEEKVKRKRRARIIMPPSWRHKIYCEGFLNRIFTTFFLFAFVANGSQTAISDISAKNGISCKCDTTDFPSCQKGLHLYSWDNDSVYNKYINNPSRLKITCLTISDYFDGIPSKFNIFENVQTVYLCGAKTTKGLDFFPKLKYVFFFGCYPLEINSEDHWLGYIEGIKTQKTEIHGFKSFLSTPKLKILDLAFSSFDKFPTDFNSLSCLQTFFLHAYLRKDTIDLSEANRSLFPCLRSIGISESPKIQAIGYPSAISSLRSRPLNKADSSVIKSKEKVHFSFPDTSIKKPQRNSTVYSKRNVIPLDSLVTISTSVDTATVRNRSKGFILSVIKGILPNIENCYELRLSEKPHLSGTIYFYFVIDEFGKPFFCTFDSSSKINNHGSFSSRTSTKTIIDEKLENSLRKLIFQCNFGAVSKPGDNCEVIYPFNFSNYAKLK